MSLFHAPHIVTDNLILALDSGNVKSYPGEPTTNLASGALYSYAPYHSCVQVNENLTCVGNSPSYITIRSATSLGGKTLSLSGYLFKNGQPFTIGGSKASTYQAASASTWSFNSTTGFFRIVQVYDVDNTWIFHSYGTNFDAGDTLTFVDLQVEEKDHPTPFVSGTRSATDGFKDLSSSKYHCDLTNIAYDSAADIFYNGVDGNYSLLGNVLPTMTEGTLEVWTKRTGDSGDGYQFIFTDGGSQLEMTHAQFYVNNVALSNGLSTGVWTHLVGTFSQTDDTMILYKNGVSYANTTYPGDATAATRYIGSRAGSYKYMGYVPIVRVYTRSLSAAKVLQHYNAHKSRFGL